MGDLTRRVSIERAAYGKDSFRAVVGPAGPEGEILDADISIAVEGTFAASFLSGDNTAVLPSDTLRRHALAECARWAGEPVENLLERIAARLLGANPAFDAAAVTAAVGQWSATTPGSWRRGGLAYRVGLRTSATGQVRWGAVDVDLLAAGGSDFAGFLRDPLTVQADAFDRPVAASIELCWTVDPAATFPPGAGRSAAEVVEAATAGFGAGPTGSVQELAYRMATTVLARVSHLAGVELTLRAVPLSPVPAELAGTDRALAHEWAPGPVGVTEVSVRAET